MSNIDLIIYSSVKPIFKIYAIISVGFYLAKKNILTISTCRDISDLIVTAIFPALIFNNIVSNLKSLDIKNLGIIFFTAILLFSIGFLLAVATFFVTKSPRRWAGGLLSVGLFPNISDLPIAYLQTLSKTDAIFTLEEGNRGVAFICIFVAAQIFFQFSLGLYKLVEYDFRKTNDVEQNNDEVVMNIDIHDGTKAEIMGEDSTKANILTNQVFNDSERLVQVRNENTTNDSSIVNIDQQNQNTSPCDDKSSIKKRNTTSLAPISIVSSRTDHANLKEEISNSTPESTLEKDSSSISSISSSVSVPESVHPQTNILQMIPSRIAESRAHRSESINEVINQYSDFNHLKDSAEIRKTNLINQTSIKLKKSIATIAKSKLKARLKDMGKNFLSPNSLSLIIAIAIAMAPPLKALFVSVKSPNIHPAPDGQPPLSFIIDIASYLGQACVPLGLLLLGATISRLKVKNMYPGFWKTAAMITISRLVILPICGVGITTGLNNLGWYDDDQLFRFVSVLEFGVPSATSLVYFTAFYTDPNSETHLQMDCLAICLIFQYLILFITLPFLVTFTLKVSLGK